MFEDLPLFSKQMARKVIVRKFNFFVLKVQEFACLLTTMVCVSLIFPPKRLTWNETLQWDTRGLNAPFSYWIHSVSVVQFTAQMSKLNSLGKTDFRLLCSRTENFTCLFTMNKLFERTQILKEWKFHWLIQL